MIPKFTRDRRASRNIRHLTSALQYICITKMSAVARYLEFCFNYSKVRNRWIMLKIVIYNNITIF